MEEIIIDFYPHWRYSTNNIEKESYFMSIHDGIFKVPLLEKQWSGRISKKLLESLLEDPTTFLSKDHDIKRKIVAEDFFVNFRTYNFTGDGKKIFNLITKLEFSYVTKTENNSMYQGDVVKIEISEERMKKIKRYNRLAVKNGWFKNRKIERVEDFDEISLTLNYKTEDQFLKWVSIT